MQIAETEPGKGPAVAPAGARAWLRSAWPRAALAPFVAATALTLVERASSALGRGEAVSWSPRVLAALFCAHACVCLAALGAAAIALGAPRAARLGARRGLAAGAVGAALLVWPAWSLGRALARGDFVSRQAWAWAVPVGAIALVAAAAIGIGVLASAQRGRRGLAIALAAGAAGACFLDAIVLPGLYEAAHVALYTAACALATLAALISLDTIGLDRRFASVAGSVAAAAVLAGPIVLAAGGAGVRAAISEAPTTSAALALVAPRRAEGRLLAAIERSTRTGDPLGSPGRAGEPALADPRDAPRAPAAQSVVLIVVDTLRADALPPARSTKTTFSKPGDTPALDGFLKGAYRLRRAYSQASQTKHSMPPLFRSLEPFEDARRVGVALPEAMKRAGIVPVAVVPQYFLMPASAEAQDLLEGFERVEVYEKDHQETLVDQALELLGSVRDRRFFAWVHFYAMHDPCFAGRLFDSAEGEPAERYRAALRWVDGEAGRLLAGLDKLGLSETTAVFLVADHGEQLGEGKRRGHGGGVRKEEIQVPLAVRIPKRKGAVVEGPAGNIDVVPTIFDLLGLPVDPQHRGQTLVPLLDDKRPSGRVYYVQNGDGSVHSIVAERGKLVYPERQGVFHRYDQRADPKDSRDLFGRSAAEDERLVSELARRNPRLFAGELANPEVVKRLAAGLSSAKAEGLSRSLSFLLRLAEASAAPPVVDAAERLFGATRDADVRAEIAQRLFSADPPRWSPLLERWLREVANRPEEIPAIRALARRRQPELSAATAAARIGEVCAPISAPCEPWLELTLDWPKAPALFARPLLAALRAATAEGASTPDSLLLAILGNAARFPESSGKPDPALDGLEDALLPSTNDPRALVATAAWRALARTGGEKARDAARSVLRDRKRDPRVRQAALRALVAIAGKSAVESVAAAGEDPLLTVDAITILQGLRDPLGLPFLRRVGSEHSSRWTRTQANLAVMSIEGSR